MLTTLAAACDETGFVPRPAIACWGVARRMNCVILFRAPGKAARGLIVDSFAMKGFRIDTKSCDWGPMCGFVCADPRLSKRKDDGTSYAEKNEKWTREAVSGHIHTEYFGLPSVEERKAWKAGVMPLAIPRQRISDLVKMKIIAPRLADRGHYVGVSSQNFTDKTGLVKLYWRLVPVANYGSSWLTDESNRRYTCDGGYYGVCLDSGFSNNRQVLPKGIKSIRFAGYEALLGMINPGTYRRGFKACVTADYDLFAIWPSKNDAMAGMHGVVGEINRLRPFEDGRNLVPSEVRKLALQGPITGPARPLPNNVPRLDTVDTRLKAGEEMEHYRFGDVSARILTIKTMLNTAIMTDGGYEGGNAIHHNDECGNMVLAKGSLAECLPLVAMVPSMGTVALTTKDDFKDLVMTARADGFRTVAKPSWLKEVGLG
jgi:hypothetical protein